MFTSRPTPILKRDFMKWTYLSIGKIDAFEMTKICAVGDEKEMDVFVDCAEDQRNFASIAAQNEKGEIEKVLNFYREKILCYKPEGKNDVDRSLNAMKDIGPVLIYSYYVEGFLEPKRTEERAKMLLAQNASVRDNGAKIIYPLYDKARTALADKYKNINIDLLTLNEIGRTFGAIDIGGRKKFYVFFGTTKGSKVYVGAEARKFLNKYKFTEIKTDVSKTEIRGLPSGGGKIIGEVQIVRGLQDMKNCVGKIIVSRDTIIEYTPMLKENLAIVTDLGGISCHAVLTAREFKIPCVVGTKYATEVLKDGDLVEVDAERGIVTVLKETYRK